MFSIFKKKPKTITEGQHISVTLYRGTSSIEAESLTKYLNAFKENNALLPMKDLNEEELYVKLEKVDCYESTNNISNETLHTVTLKGEIVNG